MNREENGQDLNPEEKTDAKAAEAAQTAEGKTEEAKAERTAPKRTGRETGRKQTKSSVLRYAVPAVLVVLLACIAAGAFLYRKYAPSKEYLSLLEYYGMESTDVKVILEDSILDTEALYQDGRVYLELEMVKEKLNSRFYWDENESTLLYTTATAVISAEPDSFDCYKNNSKATMDYEIVRTVGDTVYVALDFVQEYTALDYEVYASPTRIVIHNVYDVEIEYQDALSDCALRYEADIKSSILVDVEKGTQVRLLAEDADTGFSRVMTEEGVIGYIKTKKLSDSVMMAASTDFKEEEYTHILMDEKITMVWHQVTNQTANENLLNVLSDSKGVNVICPTWFSTSDNKGNIESLASDTYVTQAHRQGVQVWALCDDFDPDMKIGKVLENTSTRQKLAKNLVAEAIRYSLDGINIDFENVKQASGEDFVQFIRELGILCRNNGIVLSVDNYVPSDSTAYYDRAEQAAVADYVITMAYDEYYSGSEQAGPVSSISFVESATENVLKEVPAEQAVIALPFYSRHWMETTEDGEVTLTSEACSMSYAQQILADSGVQEVWDDTTGMNYLEYTLDNVIHKMWIEDINSLQVKMEAVTSYDTAGTAFWKAGIEDTSVWDMIRKYNS